MTQKRSKNSFYFLRKNSELLDGTIVGTNFFSWWSKPQRHYNGRRHALHIITYMQSYAAHRRMDRQTDRQLKFSQRVLPTVIPAPLDKLVNLRHFCGTAKRTFALTIFSSKFCFHFFLHLDITLFTRGCKININKKKIYKFNGPRSDVFFPKKKKF